jgi:SprT-like family
MSSTLSRAPATQSPQTVRSIAADTREGWLLQATQLLAETLFLPLGYTVPAVKVSVGYASGGLRSSAIGQCWARKSADDQLNHIFISPTLGSSFEVIDTLTHELVHAVDDCQHKHGKEFKKIALAIGLVGPMRNAGAGPVLKPKLEALLLRLPPYPHGKLKASHQRSVSTPPPKARCEVCGYKVTVPKRFLHLGPPICPADKVTMQEIGDWS